MEYDTCPSCESDDKTEYVVSQDGGGAVGVYCWSCETLYVDESIVYGDVEVVDDEL